MKRRTFIKSAATATAVAATTQLTSQADHHKGGKQKILEWRKWHLSTAEQRGLVDDFLKNAALPALNRLGVKPIGVFYDMEHKDDFAIYTLFPHTSLESMSAVNTELAQDAAFLEGASDYLSTEKNAPGYDRIESTIMRSFQGFPHVAAPLEGERIFELRIYESHNELKAKLKVEMFNEAELAIFDNVGLQGVFYGESLVGSNLPNLTYMIAYKNMDERKAAWGRFSKDPDWQVLKGNQRYKDTVSKIQATYLVPAPYSQV